MDLTLEILYSFWLTSSLRLDIDGFIELSEAPTAESIQDIMGGRVGGEGGAQGGAPPGGGAPGSGSCSAPAGNQLTVAEGSVINGGYGRTQNLLYPLFTIPS